ncbi:hypothetical protein CF319_g7978 [Tilletia indica]|uniref:Uncharacterized protein n=1 Tax=Tilletia indica TaxID=43049 RepID=A0A177T8J8_9BASI|nr:hypothetical protein CF319_g7978 [Tilletia indica]KAE8228895.1 hypothetical protein CF326_g6153 [Tilletia indica]KAE8241499.1 hypothetical protein A4X13_0g7390 [Tilletia indica]
MGDQVNNSGGSVDPSALAGLGGEPSQALQEDNAVRTQSIADQAVFNPDSSSGMGTTDAGQMHHDQHNAQAGPSGSSGSIDLENDGGNPSLIREATDAIRLLQDASEREHVLMAFRKAAAEAEARAKTLEEEAREAAKRAIEARSAANHLFSIIHQIERGPGAVQQQSHQNDVARNDLFLASLQPATSSAQGAFSLTSTLGLADMPEAGTQDGAGFYSNIPSVSNPAIGGLTLTSAGMSSTAAPRSAPTASTSNTTAVSGATTGSRKRGRPSVTSTEDRRCDDCTTSDTVLWRHIDSMVLCNACALRRTRASKRAHLEARKVAGAVTASASGTGGFDGSAVDSNRSTAHDASSADAGNPDVASL